MKATAVLLAFLGSVSLSGAATIFNASADFSATQNPNGAWSYKLDGSAITTTRSEIGLEGWDPPAGGGIWDGGVAKVVDSSAVGWFDAQNGDLVMHSDLNGKSNSIEWTSPASGTIDVSGMVWDEAHETGRDSGWTLALNGTPIASRNTVFQTQRTDAAAQFTNNLGIGQSLTSLSVASGDVLSLSSFKTSNGQFGHFLGVDLTVEFTRDSGSPVPSSGSTGVFALAGFGSIPVMRRLLRRKEA